MNKAMACHMTQSGEFRAGDTDAEMGFSALAPATMAAMAFAFVDHLKPCRVKLLKPFPHLVRNHPECPFHVP